MVVVKKKPGEKDEQLIARFRKKMLSSGKLNEVRDKELSEINLFSGCFLHSDKESKRYYHLSRLVVDLGILYYLLYGGFKYIEELSEE